MKKLLKEYFWYWATPFLILLILGVLLFLTSGDSGTSVFIYEN